MKVQHNIKYLNSIVSKVSKLKWCVFAISVFTFSSKVIIALYFIKIIQNGYKKSLRGKKRRERPFIVKREAIFW